MEEEGLNLDPGSKLAQLINSVQRLTDVRTDVTRFSQQLRWLECNCW